mmetsp:Transcript_13125/g.52347  ORF Transcript_13125/g.52347 Transcript_13125/m.52347 type:complete len:230 (+) Transcript_13125:1065-1754(+)
MARFFASFTTRSVMSDSFLASVESGPAGVGARDIISAHAASRYLVVWKSFCSSMSLLVRATSLSTPLSMAALSASIACLAASSFGFCWTARALFMYAELCSFSSAMACLICSLLTGSFSSSSALSACWMSPAVAATAAFAAAMNSSAVQPRMTRSARSATAPLSVLAMSSILLKRSNASFSLPEKSIVMPAASVTSLNRRNSPLYWAAKSALFSPFGPLCTSLMALMYS